MDIELMSPEFEDGEKIPRKYTCDGENVSPALIWALVPENTKKLAITCEDEEAGAGPRAHWIIYNLPPHLRGLREGIPAQQIMEEGVIQGINDFHKTGYVGPCSVDGRHKYTFRIFALDAEIGLDGVDATLDKLYNTIEGHVVAEGKLAAVYEK